MSAVPATVASRDRRPFVTVDGFALKANWRSMAMAAERSRTAAVVKADGYGLGAVAAAKTLFAAGCRDFFVAWTAEGEAIRSATAGRNVRIFVLQGLDRETALFCRRHRMIPVLSTPEDIALWGESARGAAHGSAALQIESGMNRLGLDEADTRSAARLAASGELDLSLVMSHLASADEPGSEQNEEQLERFRLGSALFPHVARSLANSAGVLLDPRFHFDLTRPGIALYGGAGSFEAPGVLRPVASLFGHVLQLRAAPAGEAAGYGAAARLSRRTRIATVGLGYADGYPRSASNTDATADMRSRSEVFVAGRRCPVLGRVSMDSTLVDVTDVPEGDLAPGALVEFFGANIAIEDVARKAGTISYELLTSLGPRVARRWI